MAISDKFVKHTATVPVNIKAPIGVDDAGNYEYGKDIGVVFHMTSSKSKRAIAEAKKMRNDLLNKRKGKGDKDLTGADIDAIEDMLVRKIATCIESWDWPEEYFEGEGIPKLSVDEAVRILKDADWIMAQVAEVPDDLQNFIVK